ncbi:hypothetical protein BASA81_000652 [Batrachochytrium salamandrivorans]|nr:hypothetical protein BASA81_000652 [Batrachochytrium salamandrivorans]
MSTIDVVNRSRAVELGNDTLQYLGKPSDYPPHQMLWGPTLLDIFAKVSNALSVRLLRRTQAPSFLAVADHCTELECHCCSTRIAQTVGNYEFIAGGSVISLPPSVLGETSLKPINTTLPDTVDVAFVRIFFNLAEIGARGGKAQVPNATVDGAKLADYSVTEMTSIYFMSSDNSQVLLDPFGLPEPINITMPLPTGYVLPNTSNQEALACGAWNNSYDGWSNTGCFVASFNATTVTCSCTHASDYAAWNAFLRNVGGGEVGVVNPIAITVVATLLPAILLVYLWILYWSARQDQRDATNVQSAAHGPTRVQQASIKSQAARFRPLASLCRGVKYDHSVCGLYFWFDPYYTRTQRATVLVCILVGNLFVSALLFDLKVTSTDITTEFMVAVVVTSALLVSIPVKLFIRLLFRSTQPVVGSTMDRVAQIYRISSKNNYQLPAFAWQAEKADIELVYAFSSALLRPKQSAATDKA